MRATGKTFIDIKDVRFEFEYEYIHQKERRRQDPGDSHPEEEDFDSFDFEHNDKCISRKAETFISTKYKTEIQERILEDVRE